MGKVYKDKKSSGCALCKPHKHGWAPKKKAKTTAFEKKMEREITETLAHADKEDRRKVSRWENNLVIS